MSARPKNEPIGEVPCPVRDCTELAKVYRFRARSEGAPKVRFAGKVYCDCPVHGRYGGDGRPATQEYILEKATIWNPSEKPAAPPAAPAPKPPATPKQPPTGSTGSTAQPAPAIPEKGSPWKTILG